MARASARALAIAIAALTHGPWVLASNVEVRDAAREIARSGGVYYDDGAWEKARDHFHRAYQLIPAPTLALMEARSLVRLGCLVQALAVYEVAATRIIDPSNEAFRRASADARTELDTLRSRVPRLTITAPDDPALEVRIDGVEVKREALQTLLPVDPGTHLLELRGPGEAKSWSTVALGEGDRRTVHLSVAPAAARAAEASRERHRTAMWTALAGGGAGLVVGLAAGALAPDDEANERCPGALCAFEERHGGAWQVVSVTGYALGLVGLATGGLLLATLPRTPTAPRLTARLVVAEGGLALAGNF